MSTLLRSIMRPIVSSVAQGTRSNSFGASQKTTIEPMVDRLLFSRIGPVSSYVRVGEDREGFFVERCVHHPLTSSKDRKYYRSLESADEAAHQLFEALKKPLGPPPSIDS